MTDRSWWSSRRPTPTQSLTLLVADALAFTPAITERQREVLVGALKSCAVGEVSEEMEIVWYQMMLDEGLQTTASFDSDRMQRMLE